MGEHVASSLNFTTRAFRGDDEITPSAAEEMREDAPPGKTDVRLTGLVSGSAKRKAEAEAKLKAETEANGRPKWRPS